MNMVNAGDSVAPVMSSVAMTTVIPVEDTVAASNIMAVVSNTMVAASSITVAAARASGLVSAIAAGN